MSDSLSNPGQLAKSTSSRLSVATPLGCTTRKLAETEEARLQQAARVYKEAFGGPPYFENYEEATVIGEVLVPHLPFYAATAEVADEIVGLVCAHPISASLNPGIREYLLTQAEGSFTFSLDQAVYLSELAVLNKFRGTGIGTHLTVECLRWTRDSGHLWCVTRTAEAGSNSLGIFLRAGFERMPFVQDVSSSGVKSSSDRRVWLYKQTQQ